jgi:hypothetical protein
MKISIIKLSQVRFIINKGNQINFEIKTKKMKIFYSNHRNGIHNHYNR